jgi:hypothetical protein
MLARVALLFLLAGTAMAVQPVYVVLWFDTEDYIEPSADDAALRIATDLERLGVHATFKVVGEKARILEARGRRDVIRALARHDIGYHAGNHSIQPTPAVYLRDLGWLDGAAEFERREGPGAADIKRIFGVTPSCYGQPGSSWGPQSYRALLKMGIPVYLDEGSQVQLNDQPFWFGNMLHVFGMGRFVMRASLKDGDKIEDAQRKFDEAAAELRQRGGGTISIYYHPTEFVTTEFWDGANFANGASRERSEWVRPQLRTKEDSERTFQVLSGFVAHIRKQPDVRFVTARELTRIYQGQTGASVSRDTIARHMAERITFLETPETVLSAAEMLRILLGMKPHEVEGPTMRRASTYDEREISRAMFDRAKTDVVGFIGKEGRLPAETWLGAKYLSIADFAATLAGDDGKQAAVAVRRANLEMEKHISNDPRRSFDWAIHPEGFSAPGLLELARLQAWTLKPARLRK